MPPFHIISRRSTPEIVFSRKKIKIMQEMWKSGYSHVSLLLARASEQGNVIGLVSVYIREYGSTLYVGLAHAVSPTNTTNFRLTFLLTRLQEALYEYLAV